MADLFNRFGHAFGSLLIVLVAIWLAGLVLVPNLMMLDFALRPNLPPAQIGTALDVYSIDNFAYLATNDIHRVIFFKTIWASGLVMLTTLLLCYPLAYWLAIVAPPKRAASVVLALTIPFWMNEVLRSLAWYIMLSLQGPINMVLLTLGIIDEPMRWYGDFGVLAGMTYGYILFMLFPIYNSISTIDRAQIDAARDLGASTFRIHRRVVIPHAKVGIATGCMFTYMLAAGSYVAPALLGAPGSRWFTQLIYEFFFEGGNWNRGAAYALLLLVLCLAVVLCTLRLFNVKLVNVAK